MKAWRAVCNSRKCDYAKECRCQSRVSVGWIARSVAIGMNMSGCGLDGDARWKVEQRVDGRWKEATPCQP
jgi:hypothetical protein